VKYFYTLKWQEQEEILKREFGDEVFNMSNDLMRPMNKVELKRFAENKAVCLGNHTHNHLNLSIYTESEIIDSLRQAEEFLGEVSTQKIQSVAYPYGMFNDQTISILSKSNYGIGHTCIAARNYIDNLEMHRFKRISLSGYFDIETQCRNHYLNFSLVHHLKKKLVG